MRPRILLLALLACLAPGFASAQLQFGITAGNGGVNSFYLAIGDYYHVPPAQVTVVREQRIPDEEIPVVFFIAGRAHVPPQAVMDFRLKGAPWMDVAGHFGLGPDVFYVPVQKAYGPPYGKAYGYFKHKKRKEWKQIRLEDADVVNLTNLRFLSEHYHYSPDQVAQWRGQGSNFVQINDRFRDKWQKEHGPRGPKRDRRDKDQWRGRDGEDGQGDGDHDGGIGRDRDKGDDRPGKGRGRGHDEGDDNQGPGKSHGHGHDEDDGD